ncbi:MAG: RNA ligase family protein, partial [Chloroflexota bacterium]|nr:RNA ligase family protein [Chloroflexota bacterium]
MIAIKKYPRTPHIAGSGIQRGDDDLATIPFDALAGRHLIVAEKMDGANCAVRFTASGDLLLQSRGHYLMGGAREQQFHLFKAWANRYAGDLLNLLEDRYIMYGEWLYAKHTVFYTHLPHYFLEFDVYDDQEGFFLSTAMRRALFSTVPFVHSVNVLYEGMIPSLRALTNLVGRSSFIGADSVERLE